MSEEPVVPKTPVEIATEEQTRDYIAQQQQRRSDSTDVKKATHIAKQDLDLGEGFDPAAIGMSPEDWERIKGTITDEDVLKAVVASKLVRRENPADTV